MAWQRLDTSFAEATSGVFRDSGCHAFCNPENFGPRAAPRNAKQNAHTPTHIIANVGGSGTANWIKVARWPIDPQDPPTNTSPSEFTATASEDSKSGPGSCVNHLNSPEGSNLARM